MHETKAKKQGNTKNKKQGGKTKANKEGRNQENNKKEREIERERGEVRQGGESKREKKRECDTQT